LGERAFNRIRQLIYGSQASDTGHSPLEGA
jgi:hypothetical protein